MWLKHVDKDDMSLVGRRAVELGQLAQAGIPIPEGFVITSEDYFRFLEQNNLQHKIKALLSTAHFEYADSLMQVSAHIKRLVTGTPLSDELKKKVAANYKMLTKTHHNPLIFLHPDEPSLGQHERHLYVHGEENLLIKIREAWASAFEAGALSYAHKHNFDHFKAGMAIVVQRMIETDISGVMLTQNPQTHDKSKIIIKTNVGGKTSHHFEIEKKHLALLNSVYTDESAVLKDSQLIELAKIGKKIEQHCYFPQYIEWAIEHKHLYILHTRPLIEGELLKKVTKAKIPLLKGIGVRPGIATGFVKKINHDKDWNQISSHDIVVVQHLTPGHADQLKKARAIISETGERGQISAHHRHLGVPMITGVKDARKTLKSGSVITVNGGKGEMYSGSHY